MKIIADVNLLRYFEGINSYRLPTFVSVYHNLCFAKIPPKLVSDLS